jgi:hypothetical protein
VRVPRQWTTDTQSLPRLFEPVGQVIVQRATNCLIRLRSPTAVVRRRLCDKLLKLLNVSSTT